MGGDHACRAGDELALFFVQLIRAAQEHPAALIDLRALDQLAHLVVRGLQVGARLFIQDHQIAGEAVQAPEFVSEQQVVAELGVLGVVQP